MTQKIGIAGTGALGSIVAKALIDGIDGYTLSGVSDLNEPPFDVPNMDFDALADQADMVIECLPPSAVPDLAKVVLGKDKDLLMLSACTLLLYPDVQDYAKNSKGRIIVPSGALSGLDAVSALNYPGIDEATIRSTKPPKGFQNAPHVIDNNIDLNGITEKTMLFSGNALDAAKAFPANVNVAATLSLAGLGPENTKVEVWADPGTASNMHEIVVRGQGSTITSRVENTPDPSNPKSSMLAAYSVIAVLKRKSETIALG